MDNGWDLHPPSQLKESKSLNQKIDGMKWKRNSLNAEVMNALIWALSSEEFNRVCNCNMAKRIWDILEVPRERTNQVKESKSIFLDINKSYLK